MNVIRRYPLLILTGFMLTTSLIGNSQVAFSASETESTTQLASNRCQGLKGAALIACRIEQGPAPSPSGFTR